MKNQSNQSWYIRDNITYHEVIKQEYSNCCFRGGFIEGHPVDTMYIELEKDGKVTSSLLLRPDEVAALSWVASGILWSKHIQDV